MLQLGLCVLFKGKYEWRGCEEWEHNERKRQDKLEITRTGNNTGTWNINWKTWHSNGRFNAMFKIITVPESDCRGAVD